MMKKTLIAAGVAVAMAVPMAATADVSLTAQVQVEVFNLSGDPRPNTNGKGLYMADAIEDNGSINSGNYSRVDLRASHDLGNGLTAFGSRCRQSQREHR
jgi:predicted porin